MKLPRRRFLQLAAAALPGAARIAWAQSYPSQPVHIVVGFAAGGPTDILARLIGQWLSARLDRQFVNAAADGHTLLLIAPANMINASLYDNLKFDFVRDIAPIASILRTYYVMEVNPAVPARTVPEFISYAKANPGKINMASAGSGTPQHVAGELFKMMAGIDMVHVPYRGAVPALTDLLGGQVQVMFDNLASSLEYIRAGRLRPLGLTTMCRPWANSCPASRRALNSASAHPRARRPRSSRGSTERSMPASPTPAYGAGLPIWAGPSSRARPAISQG
jgi:tripartite-type tricarboxylate transporter receptor subunit TctC